MGGLRMSFLELLRLRGKALAEFSPFRRRKRTSDVIPLKGNKP